MSTKIDQIAATLVEIKDALRGLLDIELEREKRAKQLANGVMGSSIKGRVKRKNTSP